MTTKEFSTSPPKRLVDDPLFQVYCSGIIRELLKQNQWVLFVPVESFVRRVMQRVEDLLGEGVSKGIEEVVKDGFFYCQARTWYDATLAKDEQLQSRAFDELHKHIGRQVRRILRSWNWDDLANNNAFCEDLQQTCLMYLLQTLDTVRKPDAFLAFIRQLIWRTTKDVVRKHRDGSKYLAALEDEDEKHSSNPAPLVYNVIAALVETIDGSLFAQGLEKAIDACLPAKKITTVRPIDQRGVIKALFLHQMTYVEIAAKTGQSVKKIRQRASRAIQELRECQPLLDFLEWFALRKRNS